MLLDKSTGVAATASLGNERSRPARPTAHKSNNRITDALWMEQAVAPVGRPHTRGMNYRTSPCEILNERLLHMDSCAPRLSADSALQNPHRWGPGRHRSDAGSTLPACLFAAHRGHSSGRLENATFTSKAPYKRTLHC